MGLEVWPARLIEVNHFGPPFDGPRATFLDVRLFEVPSVRGTELLLGEEIGFASEIHYNIGVHKRQKVKDILRYPAQYHPGRDPHYTLSWLRLCVDRCYLHNPRLL